MKTLFFSKKSISLSKLLPILFVSVFAFSACDNSTKQESAGMDEKYILEHYHASPFQVSTHMGEADDYQKALTLYNEKKYAEAITIMEKLPMESPESQMVLANAYMETKQYSKALTLLKKVEQDPNFANEAKQYIIVCLLLEKQVQIAKIELENYLKKEDLTPKDSDWAKGLMSDINTKASKSR